MSQQTMRGMRLGAQSLESEIGVAYSARAEHSYQCPRGHQTNVVFAAEAELPDTWQCKTCGGEGVLIELVQAPPEVISAFSKLASC